MPRRARRGDPILNQDAFKRAVDGNGGLATFGADAELQVDGRVVHLKVPVSRAATVSSALILYGHLWFIAPATCA